MSKKVVKWIVVGYAVLLAFVAITPLVSAEKSVEEGNWEDVEMEMGIDDKEIPSELSGESLQPRWKPEQHASITEIAAQKVGWISEKYVKTLEKYSGDPDLCPDYFDPTFATETWDWDNSQQCKHAYFVDPFDRVLKSRADEMCQHYYDLAMEEFANGNPEEAFKYLGYATHYLQDVGNPLHTAIAPRRTGPPLQDVILSISLHILYEDHVNSNWDSDANFYNDAQSVTTGETIWNPKQAVIYLATDSHDVIDSYHGLLVWDTNRINEWTHDQIKMTTAYTIGFYNYVYNNLPDLRITTDVSIGDCTSNEDAYITAGQNVTLSVDVQNLGSTVDNVKVTFFNDRDVIGTTTISSIGLGDIEPASVDWTFSSPHVIRAVVDAENKIFEQNESNNERVEKLPDLYIESMWEDTISGKTYAKVRNIVGGDTAYNVTVRFYDGAIHDNANYKETCTNTDPATNPICGGGSWDASMTTPTTIQHGMQAVVDQPLDASGNPISDPSNPAFKAKIGEVDEYNNTAEQDVIRIDSLVDDWVGTVTKYESIYILDGGKLVLDNVILNMDCTGNGQHIIRVCDGGELVVKNDATIQKTPDGDYDNYFEFIIYGKATIENSNISGLYNGLWICSDDVTISGSTIKNTYHYGIWCFSSSPTIMGCTINVTDAAVTCLNHSNAKISDCTINGTSGIAAILFSNPIIKNNNIKAETQYAGIGCMDYSNPILENNIMKDYDGIGVYCERNSSPHIAKNNFSNLQTGIFSHSSSPLIINNTIDKCLIGISLDNSKGVIKNNYITLKEDLSTDNWKIGIFCDESNPEIVENTITSDNNPSNSAMMAGMCLWCSEYTMVKNNVIFGVVGTTYSGINTGTGIGLKNFSATLANNRIESCGVSIECAGGNLILVNSTITSSYSHDFYIRFVTMEDGSYIYGHVYAINTSFSDKLFFSCLEDILEVRYYLNIDIYDISNHPVPNANVIVKDKYNTVIYNGNTNDDGYVKNIICTQYTQNGPGESYKTDYTDHTISTQKGIEFDSITKTMDCNQQHTFTLDVKPDLTLSSSDITWTEKGIFATIWNNGDAYAVNASVKFFFDGSEIGIQVLSVVPPDEKNATALLLWRDVFFNPSGTPFVEINIDPENSISESDETNNNAGNTLTVTVTSADIPTLQSPSNNSYVYNGIPIFQLTSTDPNSKNLTYRIQLSNDEFTTILYTFNQLDNITGWSKWIYNSSEVATYYLQNQEVLTEGIYYWRAQAFNGDVWCDISSNYTFTYDVTPPDTEIILPAVDGDNGWYRSNVEVTLTATDPSPGSGVAHTYYKKWLTTEPTTWIEDTTINLNSDGKWNIKYKSVDNAGNEETPSTIEVWIDTALPTNPDSYSSTPDVGVWTNNLYVEWYNANDITSSIAGYHYVWSTSTDTIPTASDPFITQSSTTSLPPSDGSSWYLHIRTRDNAGNLADGAYHVGPFWVDREPPVITLTLNPATPDGENNWYVSDVTVNLTASDTLSDVASIEYSLDGSPWTSYTEFTLTSEGEHILDYRATDNAGNQRIKQEYINIDKTPPSAPVLQTPENGNSTYDRTPTFTWQESTDSASGIAYYHLKVMDASSTVVINVTIDPSSSSYTPPRELDLGFGVHYWQVRTTDNAGNIGNWSDIWSFTVYRVYGVDLYPEGQINGGSEGAIMYFTITVKNTGNDYDNITLILESEDSNATLNISYVSLDYDYTQDVTLTVHLPFLPPYTYIGTLKSNITGISDGNPSKYDLVECTAIVLGEPPDPPDPPGKIIIGHVQDADHIIGDWDIGIGGHVTMPGGGLGGDLGLLPGGDGFCINSVINPVRGRPVSLPGFDFPVFELPGLLPGFLPIQWYCDNDNIYQTYYVNVSNPFNSTITVNLSVYGVPEGWDAYLSNYSVTLESGEYVIITLTVVIPKTTTIGQTTVWVVGTIQDYDYVFMWGVNVTVGKVPVAILRVESLYPVILENDILIFNSSYSYDLDGTIFSYEWDFGDGTNGTGMAVEHSYENAGNYIVTLIVRDNYNLTNSTSVVVSIERHSFEVNVQQISTEIMPGETAVYVINIENTGTISDTYVLRMTDMDSSWSYPDNMYLGVSAGGSITLYLKIAVSSDFPLMYNTTYNFTVTVTCMHDEMMMSNAPLTYTTDETLTVIATKESKIRYMINEVEELVIVLDSMDIQQGVKNSLQSKLENALDKLNTALDDILNGDENHADNMLNCAQNKINAFINEVEAQRGKKISEEDADTLVSTAQTIIEHINDTIATPF